MEENKMKINWKLRFMNKASLLSLLSIIVAFAYQIASFFDVVPPVSQEQIIQFITLGLTLLVSIGIITDPTTHGVSDSNQAMEYEEPKKENAECTLS